MLPAYAVDPEQPQEAIQRIVEAGKLIPGGEAASVLALSSALRGLEDAVEEARSLGVTERAIEQALARWRSVATVVHVDAPTRETPRPRLHLVR
jgi:hypothetical protein